MNWFRYNRRTPCPVCQGDRTDCRQNTTTGLVHCRSDEANPVDYVYRGQDTWGFNLWAKSVNNYQSPVNSDESSVPNRQTEVNPRYLAIRGEDKDTRERERLEKLLSIPERDRVIRDILDQLSLSDAHREILRERGISDRQINEANYRSISRWQSLRKPVDIRLSGVNQRGDKLNNPCDGILIPVQDENGLYTGLRVNNLNPESNGLGKYLWLSSKNSRGIPIDLPSGELPIATYLPQEAPEKEIIGFTEGLEYKPLLASSKMGIPIIGASGGNFGSSSGAIKAAIASIKERYGWDEKTQFILYADAGSIINGNVAIAYSKLGEIVPDLKVGDWGQLQDKENGLDIDEIDTDPLEISLI
ncbi:MAG: hypothetical protein AB4063_25285, partial [Crocosphaera sp.]